MHERAARARVQPVGFGPCPFLGVETKKRPITNHRVCCGPEDAVRAAVSPDQVKLRVALHGDPLPVPMRHCNAWPTPPVPRWPGGIWGLHSPCPPSHSTAGDEGEAGHADGGAP